MGMAPKALVGAFSVITNLRMELFEALLLTVGAARPLRPLGVWRLVLGDLLPDLGEVEDPLPGAARVDGVGEQRLVVVRADEAGVAVLLQQQHVHVLRGLVVGVPGHNIISSTVRSRVLQEYCNVRQ